MAGQGAGAAQAQRAALIEAALRSGIGKKFPPGARSSRVVGGDGESQKRARAARRAYQADRPPTADEKCEKRTAAFLAGKSQAEAKRYRRGQKNDGKVAGIRKHRFAKGRSDEGGVDELDRQSRARAKESPGATEAALSGGLDGARIAKELCALPDTDLVAKVRQSPKELGAVLPPKDLALPLAELAAKIRELFSPENLAAHGAHVTWEAAKQGHEVLAPKGKKPEGRKTSVQRAAAFAAYPPLDPVFCCRLGGVTETTPGKPTRLDLDRLEQVRRAASMVAAAREFYAHVKRTFPRRSDLEEKLRPLAEVNRRWLQEYKRVRAEMRAGRATKRDLLSAASNPPPTPAVLRPLLQLAAKIPPRTGGALKDLAPERGPGAGGGWLGNVRVNVTVAGFYASGRFANVQCSRTSTVELLAPERLTALYASGSRGGPAEVAKAVAGAILDRSRAAVESMVDQARTAESLDSTADIVEVDLLALEATLMAAGNQDSTAEVDLPTLKAMLEALAQLGADS